MDGRQGRKVVVRISCPTCGVRHYRTVTAHCGLCDFLLSTVEYAKSHYRWLLIVVGFFTAVAAGVGWITG